MIGKKINQLATELAPASTDLTIIGNPTTGVSKKITLAQLGAIFSGAVSFYTNYAAFPTPGTTDVIYCAKDTKKLYLWSGSAYVEVFPSQALLDTYQLRSEKGNANGYASLDSSGKVPISQLPSSIMEYKGTWNAATNTPTLANGTGDTGDVYICNVAGTVNFGAGPLTFAVGDYVIYSGSIWQRSSGAVGTVTSVAASITGNAIGITGSPVTTSGTLAFAFAGTSSQYINGAGNLTTFPTLTGFIPYTGATTAIDLNAKTVVNISHLGVNTTSVPTILIRAVGDNNSSSRIAMRGYSSDANSSSIRVTKFRGTVGAPQAPQSGDSLGKFELAGYGTTSSDGYPQASFEGLATESWGAIARGTKVVIKVTPNTTITQVVALTINQDKSAVFENSITGTSLIKTGGTSSQFLKADGSVDSSTYVTTDTFQTISASKTFSVGFSIASAGGTNQLTSFVNTNSLFSGSGGTNVFGFNSANNIYFGKGLDNGGVLQWNNAAVRYYTLPDADGTIALVGGSGVGTVTSVGLSSATSGITIGSTPITTSGTITLAIATASGSQQGLLSSTDWTTFNNKQNAFSGTANYIAKFTATGNTIGNSLIYDNGTNVGIGTTSPSTKLHIGGVGSAISFDTTGATATSIIQTISDYELSIKNNRGTSSEVIVGNEVLSFKTNSAERMRITSGGNVGIGTTSPSYKLVVSNSGADGLEVIPGQVTSGVVNLLAYNRSSSAYSDMKFDGANIYFATAGAGERMRITSGGLLLVGQTSALYSSSNRNNIEVNGATSAILGVNVGGGTASYLYSDSTDTYLTNNRASGKLVLYSGSGGVYLANGATSWTANSDERLKDINKTIDNALEKLMTLRAVNFSWKVDATKKENLGLIAQDVQKVFPQVIDKTKLPSSPNKEQEDNTEYLGVRYQDLVPVLIKAIQELNDKIK